MYPVRKVYLRVQIRRPFADGTAGRLAIQKKERTGRSKFTKGILSDMNQKRIGRRTGGSFRGYLCNRGKNRCGSASREYRRRLRVDPGAGHCGKTAESNRRSVLLRYFRSFSLFCGEAEEPVRIFTDHTVR